MAQLVFLCTKVMLQTVTNAITSSPSECGQSNYEVVRTATINVKFKSGGDCEDPQHFMLHCDSRT